MTVNKARLEFDADAREAVAQTRALGNEIKQLSPLAERTARSMKLFAASIVGGHIGRGMEQAGRALLNVGKSMTESAIAFDKGQRTIRTQLELTDKQYASMNRSVIKMAKTLPLPMEQIQEGLYDVYSSMDVTGREGIRLTKLFARAAVAGNADIRSTSRAAIGALNAFDLPLTKTNDVLDTQFQLVKYGVGTYEEFIQVLGEVYPSAVAADQSLESMSGAMAFATRNGLQASKAGISVARALDMISRPNYAKEIKKNLGIDIVDEATGTYKDLTTIMEEFSGKLGHLSKPEQREALADIFGAGEIRANRFFLMALNNTEELSDMTAKFGDKNRAGAMDDAYKKMAEALGNQIERVKSHLIAIGTVLGTSFFPVIRDGLEIFEKLLGYFEKLPEPVQKLVANTIVLGGVFGLVGGKLVSFASSIAGALALMNMAGLTWAGVGATLAGTVATFALVAGAVAALGYAAFKIYENWDAVSDVFGNVGDAIGKVIDFIARMKGVIIAATLLWVNLGIALNTMGMGAAGLGGVLGKLVGILKAVGGGFGGLLGKLYSVKALMAVGVYAVVQFANSFANAREDAEAMFASIDNQQSINKMTEEVGTLVERSDNFRTKVSDAFKAVFTGAPTATQQFNALREEIESARERAATMPTYMAQIEMATARVAEATLNLAEAENEYGKDSAEAAAAARDLTAAQNGLQIANRNEAIAQAEAVVQDERRLETLRRLNGISDTLLESQLNQRDAYRSLVDARRNLNQLEEKGVTKGREYNVAVDQLTRAQINFRNAQRSTGSGLKDLTANLLASAEEGRATRKSFTVLSEALGITKEKAKSLIDNFKMGHVTLQTLAEKFDLSREQSSALAQALGVLQGEQGMKGTQKQTKEAAGMLDTFIGVAESVPKWINTDVTADTSDATAALNGWMAKVRAMKVTVEVGSSFGGMPFFSLHTGGDVKGVGDVPILAQGGEYVVRRSQTQKYEPLLKAINSGDQQLIGRVMRAFQERGQVKYHDGGMVAHPALNYDFGAVNSGMKKAAEMPFGPGGAGLIQVGMMLRKLGFLVGEHPAFGGVTGGHTGGSYHYMGRAIDVNWPGPDEQAMFARLIPMLSKLPHAELFWRGNDPKGHPTHLHYAMANGGQINEPVYGRGLRSGRSYSFGERGSETVVPNRRTRTGESATEKHLHFHTVGKADPAFVAQAVQELDWIERTRGW